jgi:hypothetical protein
MARGGVRAWPLPTPRHHRRRSGDSSPADKRATPRRRSAFRLTCSHKARRARRSPTARRGGWPPGSQTRRPPTMTSSTATQNALHAREGRALNRRSGVGPFSLGAPASATGSPSALTRGRPRTRDRDETGNRPRPPDLSAPACAPAVPARSTVNDQVKPTPGRRLRGHEADACDGSRNPGTRTGPTSASTASARRYPAPRRSRPTRSAARWLRRCSPTVTPRVSRAWRRCGATEGSAASEGSDDPVDPRPRRRLRREYVLVEVTADADGDRPVVTGHLDRLPRDGQPLRRPGITGSGIHALDHRRSHSRRRRVLTTRSARSCDV